MSWLLILLQTVAAPAAPALDVATLEAQALTRHPAIRRAAADVEVARGRAAQAGTWSNPVIGGSAEELRTREQPSGVFGGFIQQTIPLGGKLGASRAAGQANVAVAESALAATRQRVVATVREHYYHVLLAEERLAVTVRLSDLAAESAVIAKQLYNVGIADQPDVLTAEAEAARAKAELVAVRASRIAAWRQLGSAVADPALAPQPLAATIKDALPVLDREATLAKVLSENGALQEATETAAAARATVNVEHRVTRPDLFVRADAGGNRESSGGRAVGPQFALEAGLSIPLFNRNRGAIASATAGVIGADAAVDDVRRELTGRFADVFAQYEGARAIAETYRVDVLPRLEQAYAMHLDKYRDMVAPYPSVLQAQRTLFQMTEQYLVALDSAWMAASALRSALAIR